MTFDQSHNYLIILFKNIHNTIYIIMSSTWSHNYQNIPSRYIISIIYNMWRQLINHTFMKTYLFLVHYRLNIHNIWYSTPSIHLHILPIIYCFNISCHLTTYLIFKSSQYAIYMIFSISSNQSQYNIIILIQFFHNI